VSLGALLVRADAERVAEVATFLTRSGSGDVGLA
jgi:hypothetical protein